MLKRAGYWEYHHVLSKRLQLETALTDKDPLFTSYRSPVSLGKAPWGTWPIHALRDNMEYLPTNKDSQILSLYIYVIFSI